MPNNIQLNTSTIFAGLGTNTFTVVTPGLYTLAFKSLVPYQASGTSGDSSTTSGGSSLVVVVNLNGSPKLTTAAPSPYQAIVGGSVTMSCVATDVITVVLTSAAAADNTLNAIKTTLDLYQGE